MHDSCMIHHDACIMVDHACMMHASSTMMHASWWIYSLIYSLNLWLIETNCVAIELANNSHNACIYACIVHIFRCIRHTCNELFVFNV